MANKFFYTDFEREDVYGCPQCLEVITNPICHDCLGKAIVQWLSFYPDIKKKMIPRLNSYFKEVNNLVMNSISCVSCSKKKAALCPYCFTEGVFRIFKQNKIDLSVIGDFLSVFNFDLKHEGYIQDAIKEKLY